MTNIRLKFSLIFRSLLCLSSSLLVGLVISLEGKQAALAAPSAPAKAHEEIGLEEHPAAWSDAIPYYNLANKYLEKARYEDAIDNYHEAIARYSEDPDFYINLGYCYRKLEDFESAEQAFRKAISLNNKDWVTWSNLANALLKQNKLPETVSTFEKCLKLTMPAKEREAINRDIADIKKILAMRKPDVKPEINSGKGALPKTSLVKSPLIKETILKEPILKDSLFKNPVAKAPEKIPSAKASKINISAPAPLTPATKDKAESTGWDYVYK